MGSFIETNDTLQITKEQWFPVELDFEKHKINEFKAKDFEWKIFEFKNKTAIRIYHRPPVRNLLAENINWKWLYWWLIHIIEINHDYINWTTSWKYKIIHINSLEEMKFAHKLVDRTSKTDFLNVMADEN